MTGRDLAEADDAPGGPDDFSALTPGSARSTLLTVLGEFVWPTGAPAWTSSLLYVLTGMGIETQTARQAIARGASAGWIEPERRGRAVMWSLTPAGRRIFEEGSPRVHSMSDPFSSWDGSWLILLVTIPHSHRTARKKLYAGLNWAGFGNPTPGVWLSPDASLRAEAERILAEAGLLADAHIFLAAHAGGGQLAALIGQAWDLDAIEQRYEDFVAEFADATASDPLARVTELVHAWRRFPWLDPVLPAPLLPAGWSGTRAAALFEGQHARWSAAAMTEWQRITD